MRDLGCPTEYDTYVPAAGACAPDIPQVEIGIEGDETTDTLDDPYDYDASGIGVADDLTAEDRAATLPSNDSPWFNKDNKRNGYEQQSDSRRTTAAPAAGAAAIDGDQQATDMPAEAAGATGAVEAPEATEATEATTEVAAEIDAAPAKNELPTAGDDAMEDIRARYRDGTMAASRPVQYRVAEQYKPQREQLSAWAREWYEANPAPGVDADQAVERFAGTWFKYALSGNANTEALLNDRALAEDALGAYTRTVEAAKAAGLRRAESIGMFNSADEIKQALTMADGHDLVTDGMVKRCMTLRRTDVVGSVGDMIFRVDQAAKLYPDRAQLDKSTIAYFATNTAPETFLDKVKYYIDTTARLEEQYQGDSAITPGFIRETVRKHADPEQAIGDRIRLAEKLDQAYGQVKGLPPSVTRALAFTESDPTVKLDRYVEHAPDIQAAHPDLPLRAVRRMCFYEDNPLEAAGKLAAEVAAAKTEFPDVLDYHLNYAAATSDDPRGYVRDRLGAVDTFKQQHPDIAQEFPDNKLHSAVFRTDTPDASLRALVAGHVLEDSREYRREHAKGPSGHLPTCEDEILAKWGSTAPAGVDTIEAARRFPRILKAYNQLHPGEADPLMERALWDKYVDDAAKLREAGFKRPEALAEYNEPGRLVARILESDTPGLTANVAESRVADPHGRLDEFVRTKRKLQREFVGQSYATKAMITYFARVSDSANAMRQQLETLRGLRTQFAEVPYVDEAVVTYLSHNITPNPERAVGAYVDRYAKLQQQFPDNTNFTHDALREIALVAPNADPESLRAQGELYIDRLHKMESKAEERGVIVNPDIMQLAAARKGMTVEGRLHGAMAMQKMRNRNEEDLNRQIKPGDAHKGLQIVEQVPDDTLIGMDPQESYIEALDAQQEQEVERAQRHTVAQVLAKLNDAEQQLVALKMGALRDDSNVESIAQTLRVRLHTIDLDSYFEGLLEKIRSEAGAFNM
jgi:hypothetical protein